MRRHSLRRLNESDSGVEKFLEAVANGNARFAWSVQDESGEFLDRDIAKSFQYAVECAERAYKMYERKGYRGLSGAVGLQDNFSVDIVLVFEDGEWHAEC